MTFIEFNTELLRLQTVGFLNYSAAHHKPTLYIFLTKDNSAKIGDLGNCQRLPDENKEVQGLNNNGEALE